MQSYEATEYSSASLSRVQAAIQALGMSIREEVSVAQPMNGGMNTYGG